jgi:hypothetical protein
MDRRVSPVPVSRRSLALSTTPSNEEKTSMRKPLLVTIALGMLAAPAIAAPPPTGTITCDIAAAASTTSATGFFFRPFINSEPRNLLVKATNLTSSCDNTNVVGGKAPIVAVEVKFSGRMTNATCESFTTTPAFLGGKVKVRWLGLNPANHLMTVGTNNLKLASASYDSGTHVMELVTQPIVKGSFVGTAVTLRLGLDDPDDLETVCDGIGGPNGYVAAPFGAINPSMIATQ